jgi:hypothetical protein
MGSASLILGVMLRSLVGLLVGPSHSAFAVDYTFTPRRPGKCHRHGDETQCLRAAKCDPHVLRRIAADTSLKSLMAGGNRWLFVVHFGIC